jgi:undecaprenyl diphosphate synthase
MIGAVEMEDAQKRPHHIAIIMDGNGRWATARGLPRVFGHRAGAQTVRRVVEACCELGVRALTLYAFSWENRDRPTDEIHELMGLLDEFVRRETPTLLANRIRLQAIGRLEELPAGVVSNLRRVIAQTAQCERLTLTLALSYGGRQEIVDAARRLAELVRRGELRPEQIDETRLAQQLYTAGLPDPDLLIRTSGEQRLSNFLLWQSSYAELYVTPKLWPDFSKDDLVEAIAEFERRERRFGRVACLPPPCSVTDGTAHRADRRDGSHLPRHGRRGGQGGTAAHA